MRRSRPSLVATSRRLIFFALPFLLCCVSGCGVFGDRYALNARTSKVETLGTKVDRWISTRADEQPNDSAIVDVAAPTLLRSEEIASVYRDAYELLQDPIAKNHILQRLAALDLKAAENFEVSGLLPESQEAYQVAIDAYQLLLASEAGMQNRDELLYALAKAYALTGESEQAFVSLTELVDQFPESRFWPEVQFRRGEHLFIANDFSGAEKVFQAIVDYQLEPMIALENGQVISDEKGMLDKKSITENKPSEVEHTDFTSNARYMLGWSQFKQADYPAAIASFSLLLDERAAIEQPERITQLAMSDELLTRTYLLGSPAFNHGDKLIDDALRAIALSFAYTPISEAIVKLQNNFAEKAYAHWVYAEMAELYFKQERFADAASLYAAYEQEVPTSEYAPWFLKQSIATLQHAEFSEDAWERKAVFADRYHPLQAYYQAQQSTDYVKHYLDEHLGIYLDELGSFYHAKARVLKQKLKQKAVADPELTSPLNSDVATAYNTASYWYRQKISAYPADSELGSTYYLLAESLQESDRLIEAIEAYEVAAYGGLGFTPEDDQLKVPNEAGYAAILVYSKLLDRLSVGQLADSSTTTDSEPITSGSTHADDWREQRIESSLLFAEHFELDQRRNAVLANTITDLQQLKDWQRLMAVSDSLLGIETNIATNNDRSSDAPANWAPRQLDPQYALPAWLASAAATYQLEDYVDAERRYAEAINVMQRDNYTTVEQQRYVDELRQKELQPTINNYASSIYKQAEAANAAGDKVGAIAQFDRLVANAPTSELRVSAQRNTIVLLTETEQWQAVVEAVPRFINDFPGHGDVLDMQRRLLNANVALNEWRSASLLASGLASELARQIRRVPGAANASGDALHDASSDANNNANSEADDLRFAAADYALKAGDKRLAIVGYQDIINNSRQIDEALYESHFKLAALYAEINNSDAQFNQYRRIRDLQPVDADRSPRAQYIVADAESQLAEIDFQRYRRLKIQEPLLESLNRKREALEKTVAAYDRTEQYAVEKFALLATERKALIYADFAKAIMESERPKGLDELALEEYEFLLEEQAYPFEEQAIALYEVNVKRAWQGMKSPAIIDSYSALSELMPARYNKVEIVQ